MDEESWRRHHGGGIWRRHHGGGIIEGGIMEGSGRRLGGIWEAYWASGKHLGGIWEAPGSWGGHGRREAGWVEKVLKDIAFLHKVARVSVSRRRDERRCHQAPRLRTKVDARPGCEIREPYNDPLQHRQDPNK